MNKVLAPSMPATDLQQVVFLSCSIMASMCISKLARAQPPSLSPHLLDHSLEVCTLMACKRISPSASLSSLDLGLQVHLQTHSIMASKFISKLPLLWPPNVSRCSLQSNLQTNLDLLPSTACSQSRYSVCRFGSYIVTFID